MEKSRKVAVLGTGRMGGAMAGTLRRAGFEVTLWNRNLAKARSIAESIGAEVAPTPAEAVAATGASGVVLTSLADDEAVRSVYLGADGIGESVGPGCVVVETSTIDPETVLEVGSVIDATGAEFLDAPVSGSVSTVEQGALTIMVGGSVAARERASAVLDALATRVVATGARGTGAITKLAVNALIHGLNVALAEALVLAEKAGVERSVAYEVFAHGAGGAPFVQYKRQAFENPETAFVAFSLDLVAKDLDLITRLGRRVGAPMRQAETDLALVQDAVAAGFGDRDISAVAVFLRGDT